MNSSIKALFSTSMLVILSVAVLAQNRPQQNIRRNVVTSRYEVIDGAKTAKYRVVHQEILDSLNRKHTILEWDFNTGQVYAYVWHVFTGMQITQTCTFRDTLLRVRQDFTYNADSLLANETIYRVTPGDTAYYANLTYTYQGKNPVQVEAKNLQGKRIWRTKSVFDIHGTEIKRTVKAKKGFFPLDSIISMVCTPSYDSLGRVIANSSTTKYFTGKQRVTHFKYTYNDKGLLNSITELNGNGIVLYRIENAYTPNGKLKFISRFNSQDVLVDYRAIRYELYPTNDRRRNRIIEY